MSSAIPIGNLAGADKAAGFRFRLVRPGRKFWRIFGVSFLFGLAALHLAPGLFDKYDNPARLKGDVHTITTNGFTLRWVEKFSSNRLRPDVVFVHGSPGGAGIWASQFDIADPGRKLIAYDRPGYGGSKPAKAQPHLQTQVDGLMTLLPYVSTNRVLLVGHSYGSPVALLAALEHPDKIDGVLLIGGDVDPAQEKPWLADYIFGWRVTSWMLPRSLRQCIREMLTVRSDLETMQKLLPHLAVPVVMLHGDRDPLVPVENVDWLEQQLAVSGKSPLFKKIILPDANHFIPWEHPDEVARCIRLLDDMAASLHHPPMAKPPGP